jgi:chemotaxis protein methyltransferase CheR
VNDREYAYLGQKIRKLLKIDIDLYREKQMRRRLQAFIERRSDGDTVSFIHGLEKDPIALHDLHEMLTIHVSEFFRDPTRFAYLRTKILPELLRNTNHLRIWSAACSHGAEPYSIAIILNELGRDQDYSIVATDIDEGILAWAAAGGSYRSDEMHNLTPAQISRFFKPDKAGYRVGDALRSRVRFQLHDLLDGESLGLFDLIVCRNVIIYFSPDGRRKVVNRLHDSLKPGGILFLGATEALLDSTERFETLSGSFYRRRQLTIPSSVSARRAA